MFRLDADLAAAEPYDWNKLYDIMVPLEPLSEEEQKDSILNWDKFNFGSSRRWPRSRNFRRSKYKRCRHGSCFN